MFRNLKAAWGDIENHMVTDSVASESLIVYGKEMFYLGAYTSLMMSSCIAKFTEDEKEAVAQIADLKKECTEFFGDIDRMILSDEEIDPEDQFQNIEPSM